VKNVETQVNKVTSAVITKSYSQLATSITRYEIIKRNAGSNLELRTTLV